KMLGRCILWQVPVEAPGTANSATFLPLKMSSVVLTCGPSAVITRNLASGSLSPTWMVIVNSPQEGGGRFLEHFWIGGNPLHRGLIQQSRHSGACAARARNLEIPGSLRAPE